MISFVNINTNCEDVSMNDISISGIKVSKNEPMSKHTSWRTGGVAKQYVQAESLAALSLFMPTLPENEALLWMGLGSNTLIRDDGFNGTVIATQGIMSQLELLDESTIYVGAGVAGAKLARFSSRNNLSGADFFAGIPGLVGGALAMNAGAFGCETWPMVVSVETINRKGEIQTRDAGEYKYSYRSVEGPKDEWFVSATLILDKKRAHDNTIDIKKLLAKRASTQPTGVASCGSVFRNPEGTYAAKLIEDAGLKGKRMGGAVVSEKHANFIINDNQASANDIEKLIAFVQNVVNEKYDVLLQPEVLIVGENK